ncbi:SDR family NAD(P)-dependent oxidoreductase [Flavobacterium gilvum]|uniref:Short-chain dehydrogenase n=1 Tax=Flavobacterium gilvum TaxID=1492737 RepID=A0AAC9I6K8_9FLAO|nr:SDR family oxidoreductase [Flavobacterium gilvum]AOW10567.1 short-chain dehydrogenase [Flavobacterium gilvum]KFC60172.1 short-chain dehydrogenase [Flavobacterium gilvum]
MQLLDNKIIFLTGGSMGIGLECAKKYAEAGAKVMIMANDEASLIESMKILGEGHSTFFGDISISSNVENAIKFTLKQYGKIDVIHNNAGIASPSKSLDQTDEYEWDKLFNINLKGVFYTTRYGLEALKQTKGCILNTSSVVAEIGQENHAAYSATKGALNALTKSMALDYAKYKIRVNAVAPAGVWTPMLREWAKQQKDPSKIEKYLDDIHVLGHCPDGDVIADACVFLVSDKARFITGNIMPVSGGAELGYRRFE